MWKRQLSICLIMFFGAMRLAAETVGANTPAELLSFQHRGQSLVYEVISTGCTRGSDFRLDVSYTADDENDNNNSHTMGNHHASVLLVRTRKDLCRMRPRAKTIVVPLVASAELRERSGLVVFDPAEIGKLLKAKVVVQNPFVTLQPLIRR